jgi:hypothetical protein
MERETWKNLGTIGAVAAALGCGALWFSSGHETDLEPQLVTVARPVRTSEPSKADGVRPSRPKGDEVLAVAPARPARPDRTTTVPGRPRPKPIANTPANRKPLRPAA